MECINCGIEFVPYKNKPGKINECTDCAEDQDRYTGGNGNGQGSNPFDAIGMNSLYDLSQKMSGKKKSED